MELVGETRKLGTKTILIGGLVTSFKKLFTKPLIFLLRAIQQKSLHPVYFAENTESDSSIFKAINSNPILDP